MANRRPDRTGLMRYDTRQKIIADVVVHQAMARLSRRRDLCSTHALTALVEAIRPSGISKRTLQRYWQAEITALRETLRQQDQTPADRRRARILAALNRAGAALELRNR